MHSSRVLGVVALGAIVVAAISFAVVDVTAADSCATNACNSGIPIVTITFAALGVLAALVSVIPAVTWIVDTIRSVRTQDHETDREVARAVSRRTVNDHDFPDDEH
ncbi:MAG: hypothetical protein ABIR17_04385 [Pseudolysinimonas sp.]|uniref:hypothetical protein n=1 Tax=Pseudolysinimonas sp. TaxID=2680009 RepID=UPI003264648C